LVKLKKINKNYTMSVGLETFKSKQCCFSHPMDLNLHPTREWNNKIVSEKIYCKIVLYKIYFSIHNIYFGLYNSKCDNRFQIIPFEMYF